MPHTPEQEKFQSFLDYFMNDYAEQIKNLLPNLNPREQQNTPILMSESAFSTCLVMITRGMTISKYTSYDGEGCVFKCDVSLNNNNLSFNIGDFVGITDEIVDHWNNRNLILENADHWKWVLAHDGEISASLGSNGFKFRLYYDNAYHDDDISLKWNIPLELTDCQQYNVVSPSIRTGNRGVLSYSVGSNDVINITPSKDLLPTSSNNILYSIKGYPFIGNTKNISNINDFITNNNATNNYSTTYTTPENKTITVYYGDNYIITRVNDDEPISYNDLQNAVNIAVNQINTDNNTDYIAPDFPSDEDKDHEIEMPVSQFTAGKNGMVYYYSLEQDDVWKVRDGLNTINLDPAVLKDVTRNLISYKLFALSPAALIKTKTPVIVHIGGREIKYNGNSIPADYVEELNSIYLGSIAIPRTYNDYRDFAPYTKIELFVPFCGWTTLPSWCMDKYITGDMYIDIMNGSCKAIIKASQTVVAELGGSCAYDVPFVADATGTKAAALLSKAATTAGAVATGNPMAIITSGISLASAMNANYTEMRGVCGDGSNINGLDRMYVKITRVSYTDEFKPERPDAYKHTYGIPCGKDVTLSQGDGYTQILDANITGNMTAKEKQMIIDGFRHGLIL